MDDRRKIRQFDVRKEKLAQQQLAADEVALEARTLAAMGHDADSICSDLDKAKTPYTRTYIETLVEEERARQSGRSSKPGDVAEDPVLIAVRLCRRSLPLARDAYALRCLHVILSVSLCIKHNIARSA